MLALLREDGGQIVVGVRGVGVQLDGFLELAGGFVEPAAVGQLDAAGVVFVGFAYFVAFTAHGPLFIIDAGPPAQGWAAGESQDMGSRGLFRGPHPCYEGETIAMRMLRLHVNLEHPQPRHMGRAVEILRAGGLAIYPTDTTYGLGCDFYAKRAIDRIYQLKGMDAKHPLSFLCADLSEVARYGIVEDRNYRILRHHMPGKYTFILPSTREVPKVVQSNARTVGMRIPREPVCLALDPRARPPASSAPPWRGSQHAHELHQRPRRDRHGFGRSVEVFLDGGLIVGEPSSVVDLTGEAPVILRAALAT